MLNNPMEQSDPKPLELASKRSSRISWPELESQLDCVAEEVPVALVYNGISHAVLMASPCQLDDLALGFSLCEGIISTAEEVYGIDVVAAPLGVEVRIDLCGRRMAELKRRRRRQAGPSGCGLCGVESLEQLIPSTLSVKRRWKINHVAIQTGIAQLHRHQCLQQKTGAVHAAAWCNVGGSIECVREDVGRHNALDKLLGQLAVNPSIAKDQGNGKCTEGFVLMSSRASYELLQKIAAADLPHLVTVSAPTSMAIEMAESTGVTLVGFAREGRHLIYSHSDGVG